MQFCFKHDLYEADAIAQPLPTAKAVGYAATAPTGLTASLLPPPQGNAGSHGAALRTGLASSLPTPSPGNAGSHGAVARIGLHLCPPPLEYRRKSCGQSYGAAGMDGARNGAGLHRGRVAGSKDAPGLLRV